MSHVFPMQFHIGTCSILVPLIPVEGKSDLSFLLQYLIKPVIAPLLLEAFRDARLQL
jgi:hypothetical protein